MEKRLHHRKSSSELFFVIGQENDYDIRKSLIDLSSACHFPDVLQVAQAKPNVTINIGFFIP